MQNTLLIVESPSKCGNIEKYLKEYNVKCIASCGHFREIQSLENIKFGNNIIDIEFVENEKSDKSISHMKKYISQYNKTNIIIATDNDREGEAIGWHICDFFKLPIKTTKRILFNEITEKAVKEAYFSPTVLNLNLIEAQMTRQVIDFIVGYKVSPVLWKLASNKRLSAGRCQSPALRLICENKTKIETTASNNIKHKLYGYFTDKRIPFTCTTEFTEEENDIENLEAFLSTATNKFLYDFNVTRKELQSPTPFSTSKLQQMASNQLKFSPSETMMYCQNLYEKGLITYMRTDATQYSDEFKNEAFNYINEYYGKEYARSVTLFNEENKKEKNSDNVCAHAHEAICVTNLRHIWRDNDVLQNKKEKTMYNFIWRNTLQSLMTNSVINVLTASATNTNDKLFIFTSNENVFLGWKSVKITNKLYENDNEEYVGDENEDEEYIGDDNEYLFNYLKNITPKSRIALHKLYTKPFSLKHTLHLSEASLVSALEKHSIGRPSTFSSIVQTIQSRKYVSKKNIKGRELLCNQYVAELELDRMINKNNIIKSTAKLQIGNEKNKLVVNELGLTVDGFLQEYFSELFNFIYTKEMEDKLDKIANGDINWIDVCHECNSKIEFLIGKISDSSINHFEYVFDDNHTFMFAKYGPVIKYTENNDISKSKSKNLKKKKPLVLFKKVIDDIDYEKLRNGKYKLDDILVTNKNENNNDDANNDDIIKENNIGTFKSKNIIVKKGRYGLYAVYGANNVSLRKLGNRPVENIRLTDVEPILKYYDNKK